MQRNSWSKELSARERARVFTSRRCEHTSKKIIRIAAQVLVELGELYKTGAIARSVGLNTNLSRTAAVSGAMADVQKPLSSLAPKALAAKLTNNPRFNAWMMQNGGPRTGSAAGTTVPLSVLVGYTLGTQAGGRIRHDKPPGVR